MQGLLDSPRQALTSAAVTALIEADSVEVDFGAELLDADDSYVDDISTDLVDGSVAHGNFNTIHGSCRLSLSRELQWGSQRVKPYMTLYDGTTTARFNLGVYLLTTPTRPVGEQPVTYDVEGYDKLLALDTPIGSTYRVASGTGYLAAVATLISAAGEAKVNIDQTSAATALPADRVWTIDDKHTYLYVVNDLLGALGYRALWVDWDGYFRSGPYESPATRPAEWTYDASSETTTLGEQRTLTADYFRTPNRWVFVRDDPAQAVPVDGAGLYVVTNQSDGPTSVDARGRTITAIHRLQAASHAALVVQGDRIVEADKRIVQHVDATVGPNPLHWHADVVRLVDPELGADETWAVQSWELPLSGGDMKLALRRVT